jgi:hypothetical protein
MSHQSLDAMINNRRVEWSSAGLVFMFLPQSQLHLDVEIGFLTTFSKGV